VGEKPTGPTDPPTLLNSRRPATSEDLPDVDVDPVGFRQRLVQGVLTHDLPQRGLGDLADRRLHGSDRHDRLHGVDHPEVGHRRYLDADVAPGDDALGLDRHCHDAQRHPVQDIDDGDEQPQSGFLGSGDPAEPEHHVPLVLLDDTHRECERDEGKDAEGDCEQDDEGIRRSGRGPRRLVVFGEAVRRRDGALCRPRRW
jgi:hypothetical protein